MKSHSAFLPSPPARSTLPGDQLSCRRRKGYRLLPTTATTTKMVNLAVTSSVLLLFYCAGGSATPVRGLHSCLNHEDCVGAHRHCHRNLSMTTGRCVCDQGFKTAVEDAVKCLNIGDHECVSDLDCSSGLLCSTLVLRTHPLSHHLPSSDPLFPLSMRPVTIIEQRGNGHHQTGDLLMAKSAGIVTKRCIFPITAAHQDGGPVAGQSGNGGGGNPGKQNIVEGIRFSGDIDHFYSFTRRNRLPPGFHPQYIKFVEDAMLVLFLLCVLVTLMVVHRASCYRNSRRNGPLRYILPHREDQPPPYSNYGPPAPPPDGVAATPATEADGNGNNAEGGGGNANNRDSGPSSSTRPITFTGRLVRGLGRGKNLRMCGGRRNGGRGAGSGVVVVGGPAGVHAGTETPPPTYDEALLISQANNALFIALPEEDEDQGATGNASSSSSAGRVHWLTSEQVQRHQERMQQQQQQQQHDHQQQTRPISAMSRRSRSQPNLDIAQEQLDGVVPPGERHHHAQQNAAVTSGRGGGQLGALVMTVNLPQEEQEGPVSLPARQNTNRRA